MSFFLTSTGPIKIAASALRLARARRQMPNAGATVRVRYALRTGKSDGDLVEERGEGNELEFVVDEGAVQRSSHTQPAHSLRPARVLAVAAGDKYSVCSQPACRSTTSTFGVSNTSTWSR